ncbi:MAG: hypothetical protein IJI41_10110 [Anaerolineaceae bacterium]|nr:hypothetical protein [Anaerolineaceae bacterium]
MNTTDDSCNSNDDRDNQENHAHFFFSLIRTAARAVNAAKHNDVWPDGGTEIFYQAVNADEDFKSTEIMNDLYFALVSAGFVK